MSTPYFALSIASMFVYGFTMAGVLVCVWIGWLRTRHVGYLILAAWSLVSMAGMAASYLPAMQSWFGRSANSQVTQQLVMWINLLRTIVSSLLLLAGIGLLVFQQPRLGSPTEPQN